jgi:hypothetical protein
VDKDVNLFDGSLVWKWVETYIAGHDNLLMIYYVGINISINGSMKT